MTPSAKMPDHLPTLPPTTRMCLGWPSPAAARGALEVNKSARWRTGQHQLNLPGCWWLAFLLFLHWVREGFNPRRSKWQSVFIKTGHQSTERCLFSCLCDWKPASGVASAFRGLSGQLRQSKHRETQVTSAGNASCPADTVPPTSDTITLITLIASIRAAGEITRRSHGLELKHFLINLMYCSLFLCPWPPTGNCSHSAFFHSGPAAKLGSPTSS